MTLFQLINLVGNDTQRMFEMIQLVGFLLGAPILLIVATVLGWLIVGWTVLIGILVILLFFPFQVTQVQ